MSTPDESTGNDSGNVNEPETNCFVTRRMSPAERKKALRQGARQLIAEAGRLGASREQVMDIVDEELRRMKHE